MSSNQRDESLRIIKNMHLFVGPLIADVIVDRIEGINPHYWLYVHTSQQGPFCFCWQGKTKWRTRSTDKISEIISRAFRVTIALLEGSCQSMVYRSVIKHFCNKSVCSANIVLFFNELYWTHYNSGWTQLFWFQAT